MIVINILLRLEMLLDVIFKTRRIFSLSTHEERRGVEERLKVRWRSCHCGDEPAEDEQEQQSVDEAAGEEGQSLHCLRREERLIDDEGLIRRLNRASLAIVAVASGGLLVQLNFFPTVFSSRNWAKDLERETTLHLLLLLQ